MPQVISASDGDTLCTLAINNGFKDCTPLRALAENADFLNRALVPGDQVTVPDLNVSDNPRGVDAKHKFEIKQRQVGIRFVHGSPNLPYAQDLERSVLNISNFRTNKAGATEQVDLVPAAHATFDANAHVDDDAFKVEVLETRPPGGQLDVIVEPIQPTYDAGGSLSGHKDFAGDPQAAGTIRGSRALLGKAFKLTKKCFRTGYLRLVVDTIDQQARPQQTVLVTDMVANGDSQTEILDQNIRATYILQDCPAADSPTTKKCRVEKVAEINRGAFVDLSIQVLRATATGVVETNPGGPGDDGAVPLAQIRDRVNTLCRRHWAQDMVKFKIVTLQTVDLPSHMLVVGDITGALASGVDSTGATAGTVGFSIHVQRFGVAPDSDHVIAPITVNAGDTPEVTAGRIAAAISLLPGLTATVSVNPVEANGVAGAVGSADILIRDGSKGRVTITNLGLAGQDSAQQVTVSKLTLSFLIRNQLSAYHVGSPNERNLYKMLDTGQDRIDVFVVQGFTGSPGLRGFTLPSQSDMNAAHQPLPEMRNTIVMRTAAVDNTTNTPYSFPHEIGHILTDDGLHADDGPQLMFGGGTTPALTDVNDSRRLIALDPPATNWDTIVSHADGTIGTGRLRMNTLSRLQEKARGLLHS
jgi:hypothetical protein